MATKQKLTKPVSRAIHTQNKKLEPIGAGESIGFEGLEQEKLCPTCGRELETNLWMKWVCGWCEGWRVKAKGAK